MTIYVIVEGVVDAAILQRIIASLGLSDIVTAPIGGKALATSYARSIALTKKAPVAVVLDADTTDESLIRQNETIFNDLTNRSGSPYPCKLFQAVPTLEEDLFRDADDVSSLFGATFAKRYARAVKGERPTDLKRTLRNYVVHFAGEKVDLVVDARKVERMLERSGIRGLVPYLKNAQTSLAAVEGAEA